MQTDDEEQQVCTRRITKSHKIKLHRKKLKDKMVGKSWEFSCRFYIEHLDPLSRFSCSCELDRTLFCSELCTLHSCLQELGCRAAPYQGRV
ncbi:hypothetical protein Mapa_012092 [Marchantia paleacea]|nr:hypothetical protein Mapa_012092 [Marchantia paleacea]